MIEAGKRLIAAAKEAGQIALRAHRDALEAERDALLLRNAALRAQIAELEADANILRVRAEAEIASHEGAIASAAHPAGPHDASTVSGKLAQLWAEALHKAGWCRSEEDWIGVIENLAQADAYEYAVAAIRALKSAIEAEHGQ